MFNSGKFDLLYERFVNNRMPHAILFYTNNIDMLNSDLNFFIKKILCKKEFCENCEQNCNICRLFDNKSLPNFIEIEPDGVIIKKNQIIDLKEKFSTKPVFSDYNIYVIKQCDSFNASSANSLLKFLEEPEDNILGFFVTNNLEKVISTIKSRCEVIFVSYENLNNNQESINTEVDTYLEYIVNNSNLSMIYSDLFSDAIYDRKYFIIFYETMLYSFEKSISQNNFKYNFIKNNVVDILFLIKNTLSMLESNVNIELAVILFAVELRNFYE